MNKNKIFKNLKKLTAVSLTAANLFTFANSGSAKILNLNNKEDKKIVLVTHFGMSPKSISPKYFSSQLNSFYTSNLEWLLKKHTNIKLV